MRKSSTRRQSHAYFALFIATLALTINFWAWSILSPLGSQYEHELNLSPLDLSLLLALPVIVGSLGRLVLGSLTDRFGGRRILAITCFLSALPVIGLIFATNFTTIALAAVFLGIGGATFAIGVPYVSEWFTPKKRGFILGIYGIGDAGTAVSGFMMPRLSEILNRQVAFCIVAALLIIVGVTIALVARNSPSWRPSHLSSMAGLKSALRQQITWDLSAVYAITFGAFVAFGVYLPILLKVAYGLSLTDAATRAAGFILLATFARPIGGWMSDKIGGKYVVQWGLLVITILATYVALQPELAITTTVAYLCLAAVLGGCSGAVFALVGRRVNPQLMGSVTGVIGTIGGLGGFIPPLILGATYQLTHSYIIALLGLAAGAIIVFFYVLRRFRDKKIYKLI